MLSLVSYLTPLHGFLNTGWIFNSRRQKFQNSFHSPQLRQPCSIFRTLDWSHKLQINSKADGLGFTVFTSYYVSTPSSIRLIMVYGWRDRNFLLRRLLIERFAVLYGGSIDISIYQSCLERESNWSDSFHTEAPKSSMLLLLVLVDDRF